MGGRRVAGAEDEVALDVDSELLLELGLDVDLGQHSEALAGELGPAARDRLVERQSGHDFVGDSGVTHGLFLLTAVESFHIRQAKREAAEASLRAGRSGTLGG